MILQHFTGVYGDDVVVRPITWNKDRNKVIYSVSSSTEPGEYYYFDKENVILTFMWDRSPWIDRSKLSKKVPIQYTARDGLEIHGYLTVPLQFRWKKSANGCSSSWRS